jgi:hypothetical protein
VQDFSELSTKKQHFIRLPPLKELVNLPKQPANRLTKKKSKKLSRNVLQSTLNPSELNGLCIILDILFLKIRSTSENTDAVESCCLSFFRKLKNNSVLFRPSILKGKKVIWYNNIVYTFKIEKQLKLFASRAKQSKPSINHLKKKEKNKTQVEGT